MHAHEKHGHTALSFQRVGRNGPHVHAFLLQMQEGYIERSVFMSKQIRKITTIAMLTAISAVLITLIHFPLFPSAAFLEYDPADVAILLGAFACGPIPGVIITVLASFIQAFFLGGNGVYGFLMHTISSGVLAITAGTIYHFRRTRTGALLALIAGTITMGLVMVVANHFITPVFMGAPVEVVDSMLLPVILPFNLLKAGINSLITFLIYKPLSPLLHKGSK